jgi:hypothetical protein
MAGSSAAAAHDIAGTTGLHRSGSNFSNNFGTNKVRQSSREKQKNKQKIIKKINFKIPVEYWISTVARWTETATISVNKPKTKLYLDILQQQQQLQPSILKR